MPVTKSAKRALRVSLRNKLLNEKVRKSLKKTVSLLRSKRTQQNLAKAYSILDRAVKLKVIHKNKASRLKSKLTKLISKSPIQRAQTKKTAYKKSRK